MPQKFVLKESRHQGVLGKKGLRRDGESGQRGMGPRPRGRLSLYQGLRAYFHISQYKGELTYIGRTVPHEVE